MAAAYPTVFAALVDTLQNTLSGTVRVVDGFDVSGDPGDSVSVGVPSLSDANAISAGAFTQEMMAFHGPRRETGSINGVAMAWNGQGDQAAARAAAFGYIALIEDALRSDRSLGITTLDEVVAQFNSGDIAEDKVDGATTAISFTVAYSALI